MGPIWGLSAPDGPHVGPMNLAIRVASHNWLFTDSGLRWISLTKATYIERWCFFHCYPKQYVELSSIWGAKPFVGVHCIEFGWNSWKQYHLCKSALHLWPLVFNTFFKNGIYLTEWTTRGKLAFIYSISSTSYIMMPANVTATLNQRSHINILTFWKYCIVYLLYYYHVILHILFLIITFRAPSQYKDRLIYVWWFPC